MAMRLILAAALAALVFSGTSSTRHGEIELGLLAHATASVRT